MLPAVLSGAGAAGRSAAFGLAIVLALATAAYLFALARPPATRFAIAGAVALVIVLLASPTLFSADVYAYAYYGDLVMHGHSAYAHDPRALSDPLARAATRAWDGTIPPRCIYGPLAVALAVLGDAIGAPFGAAGAIAAQRALALGAFALCALVWARLVSEPRARIALACNPVAIWSAVEGHNDAAMLALALLGFAWPRLRGLMTAAATLVKAPALLLFAALQGNRTTLAALAVTAVGYAPLAFAALTDAGAARGAQTPWDSPLGLVAAHIGRPLAFVLAALALAVTAAAVQRLPRRERAAAFAFVAWFALPNAYPWYGIWLLPLAARDMRSPWAAGLIAAGLAAPIRAMTDATFANAGTLHGEMIALQFLPPLVVRVFGTWRAPRAAILALAALLAVHTGASAQTAPTPLPIVPPSAAPSNTPEPLPSASGTPLPGPTPGTTPAPAPTSSAGTPAPVPTQTSTPLAAPLPNPYGYILTPPPATQSPGDGPHILQIALNDRTIHAGGPLLVRVLTSPNVVGVEARALGRFIAIPASGPGTFSLQYTLPSGIPFWLMNKNYDIVIAAATPDGRQITMTVPLTLAR